MFTEAEPQPFLAASFHSVTAAFSDLGIIGCSPVVAVGSAFFPIVLKAARIQRIPSSACRFDNRIFMV